MARRPRTLALLAVGFPLAACLVLRWSLLPPAWLGVPDALFTVAIALGVGAGEGAATRVVVGAGTVLSLFAPVLWPERAATLIPVVMNLLLARLFQATLRPGSEPLITRIARLARDEPRLPDVLAAYTRHSTLAWAGLFLALAANSLLLALFASVETAMLFANTANFGLIALFFGAETVYRHYRYGDYWHPPVRQVLATLLKHGWRAPDNGPSTLSRAPGQPG